MVDIRIYVEGGVLQGDNTAIQTIDNSEKLRESFYHLFSQYVDDAKFNLIVEIGAGEKQAANFFKSQNLKSNNSLLVIDLDKPSDKRDEKIQYLELQNNKDEVIFMVQKMEAWILSQPERIDRILSDRFNREKINIKLSDDNNLQNKHPEEIQNPDRVLNTIFQRYFSEIKRGKKKKKKYGKLKDAPVLLISLDAKKLKKTFTDVENLYNILNN